jgi:hypothetical protein
MATTCGLDDAMQIFGNLIWLAELKDYSYERPTKLPNREEIPIAGIDQIEDIKCVNLQDLWELPIAARNKILSSLGITHQTDDRIDIMPDDFSKKLTGHGSFILTNNADCHERLLVIDGKINIRQKIGHGELLYHADLNAGKTIERHRLSIDETYHLEYPFIRCYAISHLLSSNYNIFHHIDHRRNITTFATKYSVTYPYIRSLEMSRLSSISKCGSFISKEICLKDFTELQHRIEQYKDVVSKIVNSIVNPTTVPLNLIIREYL